MRADFREGAMTESTVTLRQRPGVLCILDGWGWRPEAKDNAIAAASQAGLTPNFDRMLADCPHALLATSGRAVGLPVGQMGNSEVGHMNIGAGRTVMQDLPRIDDAMVDGSLAKRPGAAGTDRKGEGRQPGRACDGADVARRRPQPSGSHRGIGARGGR